MVSFTARNVDKRINDQCKKARKCHRCFRLSMKSAVRCITLLTLTVALIDLNSTGGG